MNRLQVYHANVHPKFPDGGKMTQHLESLSSEWILNIHEVMHTFNTSIHPSTLQSTTQFDQPYFSRRHNWCEGARGTAHVWGEGGVWVEGGQESCSQASEGRKCYRSTVQRTSCQAKQVSMIAGGTGITPMLQLVSLAENIKKGKKEEEGVENWKCCHDTPSLLARPGCALMDCQIGWKINYTPLHFLLFQDFTLKIWFNYFYLPGASSVQGPRGHHLPFSSACKPDRGWHTAQVNGHRVDHFRRWTTAQKSCD